MVLVVAVVALVLALVLALVVVVVLWQGSPHRHFSSSTSFVGAGSCTLRALEHDEDDKRTSIDGRNRNTNTDRRGMLDYGRVRGLEDV